jgi:hypothetical protein
MTSNHLGTSVHETIAEGYSYGYIGDIKLVIRRSDGYVNASKLCTLMGKQDLAHWKRLSRATNFVKAYLKRSPYTKGGALLMEKDLFQEVTNADLIGISKETQEIIQGTYVPDLVAIELAYWGSPDFALTCTMILRDHFNEENLERIALLNKKNNKLKKKNVDLMAELREMDARMQARTDAIIAEGKVRTDAIIAESRENTDRILSKLDRIKDTFFNYCSNDTTPKKKQEGVVIYKVKGFKYGEYDAHMRCGQQSYLQNIVNKLDLDVARGFKHIANSKKAKHNVTDNKYVSTTGCLIKLNGITFEEYMEVMADTNRRLGIMKQ